MTSKNNLINVKSTNFVIKNGKKFKIRGGGSGSHSMIRGGSLNTNPAFRNILSIGYEFETHDLAKLSLHQNKRSLINSDLILRVLKDKIESNSIKEVLNENNEKDENYLSVRIPMGNEVESDEHINIDDMDEEEREFHLEFADEIELEKLEKRENNSYLEYFNEPRKSDVRVSNKKGEESKRTLVKFQITNDLGDGEFAEMLRKHCEKLTIPKNKMYVFKTQGGKIFDFKFSEDIWPNCETFSGVEYVVTYYSPKRDNPNIILETFVDACSRIVDHLADLKSVKGELMIHGSDKRSHYVSIGNIGNERCLYRKPNTNLFYIDTYDNVDTQVVKKLGDAEFIPQMTFRSKAKHALDIMKEALKPDTLFKKGLSDMAALEIDYNTILLIEEIVDDVFEKHNESSKKKISTSLEIFQSLKLYIFLIYYKLFAYIQNHNSIMSKEDYLKDKLAFASRHSNQELYARAKAILKDHYKISSPEEIRKILCRSESVKELYEIEDFEEEDFNDLGEYKYENALTDELAESNPNYGNPLYSLSSYFAYFETAKTGEKDWFIDSKTDNVSTRFDLTDDIVLLENRLFKDEMEILLKNKINIKLSGGLLPIRKMRDIVYSLYGDKIKNMVNLEKNVAKRKLSKKCPVGYYRSSEYKCAKIKNTRKSAKLIKREKSGSKTRKRSK